MYGANRFFFWEIHTLEAKIHEFIIFCIPKNKRITVGFVTPLSSDLTMKPISRCLDRIANQIEILLLES